MKADTTAHDVDLSSIPGEFRQNYRFLTELIDCREQNSCAIHCLEALVEKRLSQIRGKLNRRQIRILTNYFQYLGDCECDALTPPVPAELEASIRIKKRSTWLPWEAEAIRKIERWRGDVRCIMQCWNAEAAAGAQAQTIARVTKAAESSKRRILSGPCAADRSGA